MPSENKSPGTAVYRGFNLSSGRPIRALTDELEHRAGRLLDRGGARWQHDSGTL